MNVSRRALLMLGGLAVAILLQPLATRSGTQEAGTVPQGRPNILWIMTDEQRTDSLGCYGNPWIKTPHLDELARKGVVFSSAYVQSPVCVPSRAAILTGRYPHSYDVLVNQDMLPARERLFPEIFYQQGYQTVNVGKLHHHGPRPGFHYNFQMEWGEDASAFELRGGLEPKKYNVGVLPGSLPTIIYGTYPAPADRTLDAVKADYAVEFLKERARTPFLMRVSFNFPHTPVLPPQPYDRMYDPQDMEVPQPTKEELDSKPEIEKAMRESRGSLKLTEMQVRLARSHYYGLVSHVDSQVGRLLETLRETGLDKNTIVVFTSDHGTLLGEHGLFFKMVFYRQVTNVPLIISAPGILPEGKTMDESVEVIDLAPTLLELAGIKVPSNMHGKSLLPLINGDRSAARDRVFGEIRNTFVDRAGKVFGSLQSISRSVRTREWLYISVWEDEKHVDGALYDLKQDPGETVNLYRKTTHQPVVKELEDVLQKWLQTTLN